MATSNHIPATNSTETGTGAKPPRFTPITIAAYTAAAVGVLLIVISGVYVYSRAQSGSDAAEFAYTVPEKSLEIHLGLSADAIAQPPVDAEQPISLGITAPDVARFASLYPGNQINPKYWAEPEWAGSDPYGGPTIPDDFIPIRSTDIFTEFDSTVRPSRMRIPAIGVDSVVTELELLNDGAQQSYENPDRVIGHIPETATPGQQGRGWYFAHLESYAVGEGNIFRRLPQVTDLIKQDVVDVYIETSSGEFVYRVTGTRQVNKEDLVLTGADNAQITLVASWPRLIYDQRILVDATLIAYRPL